MQLHDNEYLIRSAELPRLIESIGVYKMSHNIILLGPREMTKSKKKSTVK